MTKKLTGLSQKNFLGKWMTKIKVRVVPRIAEVPGSTSPAILALGQTLFQQSPKLIKSEPSLPKQSRGLPPLKTYCISPEILMPSVHAKCQTSQLSQNWGGRLGQESAWLLPVACWVWLCSLWGMNQRREDLSAAPALSVTLLNKHTNLLRKIMLARFWHLFITRSWHLL